MSTATAEPQSRLRNQDLVGYPRKVRRLVLDLVNNHGVRVRVQSGTGGSRKAGHLFLYNGDRGRPFKVSASRPEEQTLRYLEPWALKNTPGKEVSVQDRPDEQKQQKQAQQASPEAGPDASPTGQGPDLAALPFYESPTRGTSMWFKVDQDRVLYCIAPDCGFSTTHARGLYRHEAKHDGTASELSRKSAETAALLRQQRKAQVTAAIMALAEVHGVPVGADAARLRELEEENDRLRTQVHDLEAKLALVREASAL